MIDYKTISERIKNNSGLVTALNVLDKAITYITVVAYIGLLGYAAFQLPQGNYLLLYRSILVPGVSFALVSYFRKTLSAPRPYEVYDFVPALKKDTKGRSFPSRHVFSIFMVAYSFIPVFPPLTIILSVLGLALDTIRVIGGVHFIKDVVAGSAIATIITTICTIYWN